MGRMNTAPELHPYRSSARRARITIWLLLANAAFAAAQVVAPLLLAFAFPQASRSFNTIAAIVIALGWTVSGVFLLTAIAFLAWLSRAIDNVPALGGGTPSASPRWAIAWWFIPFANLGMPYEVVRDLDARTAGDARAGHPPLLVAWWFTFVGASVLESVVLRLGTDTAREAARPTWSTSHPLCSPRVPRCWRFSWSAGLSATRRRPQRVAPRASPRPRARRSVPSSMRTHRIVEPGGECAQAGLDSFRLLGRFC